MLLIKPNKFAFTKFADSTELTSITELHVQRSKVAEQLVSIRASEAKCVTDVIDACRRIGLRDVMPL
jgi:hypothetical protein